MLYPHDFDTPAIIILRDVASANVASMGSGLKSQGIAHRPHIKAHKSVELAKLQLAFGAQGITCAKISEAEVMVNAGIRDVLIANEIIGAYKCTRLARLAKRAQITTVADSKVCVDGLSEAAQAEGSTISLYIDVEIGAKRCGAQEEEAYELAKYAMSKPGIRLVGIMGYANAIYSKKAGKEMEEAANEEREALVRIRRTLADKGIRLPVLSSGSSYSSRYPDQLGGITESRAGNYIFNDVTTLFTGSCTVDDCAIRVVARVISIPAPGRLIIDAGSKTLTSDTSGARKGFGYIVEYPEMEIYALNEEHGYVHYDEKLPVKVGELLTIIPNHACMLCNLENWVWSVTSDGAFRKMNIEARGCNK